MVENEKGGPAQPNRPLYRGGKDQYFTPIRA
jgi:hypothetical protein